MKRISRQAFIEICLFTIFLLVVYLLDCMGKVWAQELFNATGGTMDRLQHERYQLPLTQFSQITYFAYKWGWVLLSVWLVWQAATKKISCLQGLAALVINLLLGLLLSWLLLSVMNFNERFPLFVWGQFQYVLLLFLFPFTFRWLSDGVAKGFCALRAKMKRRTI